MNQSSTTFFLYNTGAEIIAQGIKHPDRGPGSVSVSGSMKTTETIPGRIEVWSIYQTRDSEPAQPMAWEQGREWGCHLSTNQASGYGILSPNCSLIKQDLRHSGSSPIFHVPSQNKRKLPWSEIGL
jgi:hypothetical protein